MTTTTKFRTPNLPSVVPVHRTAPEPEPDTVAVTGFKKYKRPPLAHKVESADNRNDNGLGLVR